MSRPGPASAPSQALATELERSRELGFLGPGPVEPHLRNGVAFLPHCRGARRILDLGSGGGVPGLVLAEALPDTEFVLLDSQRRRTEFLVAAVQRLGWIGRVQVVTERAEVAARRPDLRAGFDVVVARSFGPPPVLAECARGFVGDGGRLLVSEPPTEPAPHAGAAVRPDPRRWPESGLATLGWRLADRSWSEGTTVQVLIASGDPPADVPRTDGMPGRRPRW